MDPPGRGTLWRYTDTNPLLTPFKGNRSESFVAPLTTGGGFLTTSFVYHNIYEKYKKTDEDIIQSNYNDNENNCGGLSYQISQNYECGVCGDAVGSSEPRKHEDRGKYGLSIISAQYPANSIQTTKIQITAHHKGLFNSKSVLFIMIYDIDKFLI